VGEGEHDPRRWATSGSWSVEQQADALARAPAFGARFFAEVFRLFPALAGGVAFLRWSMQPEDVYAVFESPAGGLGVQVDPHLEYLIVWGAGGQAEYGPGGGDQVAAAVDHVRRLVAGAGTERPTPADRPRR
jgi:hypothetical protein